MAEGLVSCGECPVVPPLFELIEDAEDRRHPLEVVVLVFTP